MKIRAIARLAEVSTATISHVINGTRFINDEVKEKVRPVIEQTGYTPNAHVRNQAMRQNHTFGLILSDLSNPFFPKHSGMHQRTRARSTKVASAWLRASADMKSRKWCKDSERRNVPARSALSLPVLPVLPVVFFFLKAVVAIRLVRLIKDNLKSSLLPSGKKI